jgi:5-methylcytosine-specific restriction enzyme A
MLYRMSVARFMPGGRVDPATLPKGPLGRNRCRWCDLEVPSGRCTFCSEWCVNEWKLRTDPGYLRDQVFARDRGICALCGLDCAVEWRRIQRKRGALRRAALVEWGVKPGSRRSLWDADHIVPVVEGGGECDLSNLRTLCLRCHRSETARLRARRTAR